MSTNENSGSVKINLSKQGDGAQVVANQTADPQNLSRCNYVSEMLLYSKTLIPASPVESVIKRPLNGFSGPNYFYYNLGTRSPTSPTHCTLDLLTMSLPWSSIDSILFEIFSLSSTLGHHEQFQPAVTPLMRDMEIFTAGHQ